MDHFDEDLQALIAKGKFQGYLTYDEVNDYLPDEDVTPEKLDNLLIALDDRGIELVDQPPQQGFEQPVPAPSAESIQLAIEEDEAQLRSAGDIPKLSDDPIRMYLSQMAEVPLLKREQEIALAKKIEVTRRRFRRTVLGSHYAMEAAIQTLSRVHQGDLPFDRTIKVSQTERLTKEQILGRMPHNLKTLERLLKENKADFTQLIRKSEMPPGGGRDEPADATRSAVDVPAGRVQREDGRDSKPVAADPSRSAAEG